MMKLCSRAASLVPTSIDVDTRSVDAVLATEAPAQVVDWERMELIDEVLLMNGVVLPRNNQVPLLDAHSRYSNSHVIGSTRGLRVEGEQLVGRNFLARSAGDIWEKIADGHITDNSVGYRIIEATMVRPGETAVINGRSFTAGRVPLRVVTKWQLRENSIVPIGADDAAKMRADMEVKMATEPTPAQETAPVAVDPAVAVADGARLERERAKAINALRSVAADTPGADEIVRKAVDDGWTVERAQAALLEKMRDARNVAMDASRAPAVIVRSGPDKESLAAGLMVRCGINPVYAKGERERNAQEEAAERGHRFSDMSGVDLCRHILTLAKIEEPVSRVEMVQRAMSSGDFSGIFTTSASAQLVQSFQEAGDTTVGWCRESDVSDFKTQDRTRVNPASGLKKLGPGGTAEHITLSDALEQYKIARYAGQFVIDEQDLLNDSLEALRDQPEMMGASARRLRPRLVYGILLSNPTLGQDSTALFHADHNNTATNAFSEANLGVGRTAMSKQTAAGQVLNLTAKFLLVPQDLRDSARIAANSPYKTGTASPLAGVLNPLLQDEFVVVSDALLGTSFENPVDGTTVTGTATNWFIVAPVNQAAAIEVGYLRGTGRQPRIRSSILTLGQYGIQFDVNLDIGAKALAFQPIYRGNV